MKHIMIASVFATTLPGSLLAEVPQKTTDNLVQEARGLVKQFGGSLKSALQAAIKEGGLTNGIGVCKTIAPEIAAKNSDAHWTISRTSLKVRNPDNAATEWQQLQLEAMARQPVKDGKPVEVWQVSEAKGEPGFKYMSAIPTQQMCLGCHGKNIAPEVQAKLDELYPEDQATGFSEGDLRGAFVISWQQDRD